MQIQEDIANLIAQIADTMQELEEEEKSALAQLDKVEAEPSTSTDGDQSLPPIEEARATQRLDESQKLYAQLSQWPSPCRVKGVPNKYGDTW